MSQEQEWREARSQSAIAEMEMRRAAEKYGTGHATSQEVLQLALHFCRRRLIEVEAKMQSQHNPGDRERCPCCGRERSDGGDHCPECGHPWTD